MALVQRAPSLVELAENGPTTAKVIQSENFSSYHKRFPSLKAISSRLPDLVPNEELATGHAQSVLECLNLDRHAKAGRVRHFIQLLLTRSWR